MSLDVIIIGHGPVNKTNKQVVNSWMNASKELINQVIVVWSGTEGRKEFDTSVNVRYSESIVPAGQARNMGANEAKSQQVLFVDSDMELFSVSELEQFISSVKEKIAVVNWIDKVGDVEKKHYPSNFKSKYFLAGGLVFVDRQLYTESGGMNPKFLRSQDWEWSVRQIIQGHTIEYIDRLFVKHHTHERYGDRKYLENIFRRKNYIFRGLILKNTAKKPELFLWFLSYKYRGSVLLVVSILSGAYYIPFIVLYPGFALIRGKGKSSFKGLLLFVIYRFVEDILMIYGFIRAFFSR